MKRAAAVLAAMPLFGCATFLKHSELAHDQTIRWTTPASFTTADVRIITQRIQPVTGQTVICTEPNPDVAKAFANAFQASAKGGNGTVTASAGLGANAAEAVAELAGRSTALLGLRDGLYRACEAYANGAIGADAYALVLGRYSQLMTTLFLGQDITGVAGAEGKAMASANLAAIAAEKDDSAPKDAKKGSDQGTGGTQQDAGGTDKSQGAKKDKTSKNDTGNGKNRQCSGPTASSDPSCSTVPATSVTGPEQNCAAAAGAANEGPKAKDPKEKNPNAKDPQNGDQGTKNDTSARAAASAPGGVSAAAAIALTRMNEDYLNLDLNLLHSIVIACINEDDPTHVQAASGITFLKEMCGIVIHDLAADPEALVKMQREFINAMDPYITPVDPLLAVNPAAEKPAAKPTPASRR